MSVAEIERAPRLFVIVNPSSGNCSPNEIYQALARHLPGNGVEYRAHELAHDEDLVRTVRKAVDEGHEVIVAAGGDGTVSSVANAIVEVGEPVALGIVPLGTTNVLARELNVPIDIDAACALLTGSNSTAVIDGMCIENSRYCFTQIGIGVDALMIRDTTTENKKRFGYLAYLWTAAVRLVGFQARRFSIAADEEHVRTRAAQVLVANCGALGTSGLRWGPDMQVADGRIDICIIRANSLLDYVKVAWSMLRGRHRLEENIRYLSAVRTIEVHAGPPLPIQADGEVIGETPLRIRVVPRALRAIVPAPGAPSAESVSTPRHVDEARSSL